MGYDWSFVYFIILTYPSVADSISTTLPALVYVIPSTT